MKKLVIALTAIVAMASCKKESVAPAPAPVSPVTKTLAKATWVYNNGTPETETYTYNAKGRIASIKDETITATFDFVSAASLVVTERFSNNNNLAKTKECTINEKGYITKIVVKNPAGGLLGTYDYNYNADGFVTGYKVTYPSGSTKELVYAISNGNAVSVKEYSNNVLSSNTEFTYDNTKANKTGFGVAYHWSVPNLFGKCTKNMIAESKTFNTSGKVIWHEQNTYDMDANGYPAKQTINYPLQGKQGVNTFVYQ